MNIPRHAAVLAGAVAILLLAVVYGMFDPSSHLFPRCPFHALTGFECPGCGSQRALHALLHADVAAAWHFNALLVASLPVLCLMVTAQLFPDRFPRLHGIFNSSAAIYSAAVILIVWWVVRNVAGV